MLTIITLPSDFVTNISTNASGLVNDLSGYIELVIGVLLAVVIVTVLIQAIRHH